MASREQLQLTVESAEEEELYSNESESEHESEDEDNSGTNTAAKVLSGLRRAEPAAISKPRALLLNPPGKRKRKRCGPSTKLMKKSLHDCAKDHPGEHIVVQAGVLFCAACRTQVSAKASSIKRHIYSKRHAASKRQRGKEGEKQQSIIASIHKFDQEHHPLGETIPENERSYRLEVVETFLKAGVALAKVGQFRNLLEKHGTRLACRSTLSRMIPIVLARERDRVKTSITDRSVSVIYDGCTRLGEALVIVLRFLDDQWTIHQVLVRLKVLSKSLNGEGLAGELIHALSTSLQIKQAHVVAAMRDGASVNGAAMRVLKAVYPRVLDVTCFSHTIDLVGTHFELPTLDRFAHWWIQLFSRSCAAKLRWKERTGAAMKTFSATRWWSRWEVMDQILTHFGDVGPFLDENKDIAPRIADHLRALLADEDDRNKLIIELCAVIDAGEPFVKATYNLEGDGLLVFNAYSILQGLSTAAAQRHYPNVAAQAKTLGTTPEEVATLSTHARQGVEPGIHYFLRKFNVQFYDVVRAFKAARFACPVKVQELKPQPECLETLRLFPFLNDDATIANLQKELPTYLAEAEGVKMDEGEQMQWWHAHQARLPHWSTASKLLALVQPSSAPAERVFSLLRAAFNDRQTTALEDDLEASVMMAYNHRKD